MKFEDLKFESDNVGLWQATAKFDPYTLVIISESDGFGGREGLFGGTVFKDSRIIQLPGITDRKKNGVIGWLTKDDIEDIMKQLSFLSFAIYNGDDYE